MWHLVCGDLAAASVADALGEAVKDGLHVLRDDLAVGPLVDIEQPPCAARAAFWLRLWPAAVQPVPNFDPELGNDAQWLAALAKGDKPVTVWSGDSCSEQLLLARVAHALQGSNVQLWEVACANPQRPPRKAVSLRTNDELRALYQQRSLLSPEQRTRLAGQWQHAIQRNADIRCWLAGEFSHHDYRLVDERLLQSCRAEWQPLARVMADVMAHSDGFFPSDSFLHWRALELAAMGQIELAKSSATAYAEQQARLPA